MSDTTAERSPYELAELYNSNPDAYRDQVDVVDAGRRVVAKLAAVDCLRDPEESIAAVCGSGSWTIRLIRENGRFGEQAVIRTARDLRPREEREPEGIPPNPFQSPAERGLDPFVMFQTQQQIDLARRDRDDAMRKASEAESQLRQTRAELDAARRQLTDSEQRGYERGFDKGEQHGVRITKAMQREGGDELLSAQTITDLIKGFAGAAAAKPAAAAQPPPPPDTIAAKLRRVLEVSVELGMGPGEPLAHQVAAVLGLSDVTELLQPDVRERLVRELQSDAGFVRWLGETPPARELVESFQAWLAELAAPTPEVVDPVPEADTSAETAKDIN